MKPLFYFGLVNFVLAIAFGIAAWIQPTQFMGVNAWYKPIKFALSIGIYVWTLAFFSRYLESRVNLDAFNAAVILSLGFEIVYIAYQAAQGKGSHFNVATSLHSFLYSMMAVGATVAALAGAWLGYHFFTKDFPQLDPAYLWSIRLGFVIFVIFAFQGFAMGSRLAHTVGAPDGGPGLPFVNWSRSAGDLRIAHFMGMHALQVIPFLTYWLIRDVRWVFASAGVYLLTVFAVFFRALAGRPLF
ncbi:MAG: hypothetical protein JNL01_12715 [Bdellovibrionales bacterium]|nr:hypothetical protein [Bdellovibrionales bacterium]